MANYRLTPDPTTARGSITVGDPAEREKDCILLGHSIESGPHRDLWLDISGEQVVAVFGKRGTGKSYTLGVLLEAISAGKGETKISKLETPRGALVFDIMDIYWTSTIALRPDGPPEVRKQYEVMRKRGFTPVQLNIDVWVPAGFERSDIDPSGVHRFLISPSDLSLDDWGSLFEVDVYTEPRGMLIADLIQHVGVEGYTQQDGTTVGAKGDFNFNDLLACLENDASAGRFSARAFRSVRARSTSGALPLRRSV